MLHSRVGSKPVTLAQVEAAAAEKGLEGLRSGEDNPYWSTIRVLHGFTWLAAYQYLREIREGYPTEAQALAAALHFIDGWPFGGK